VVATGQRNQGKTFMHRRNLVAAISGAMAIPMFRTQVALGQTTAPTMLDPTSYTNDTLQIGTLSKTVSQLATQASKNPLVLRFAKLEIDEQTAVSQSLTSNYNPPPAQLTDQQQQMVQALQSKSGSAFDIAYLNAQIQGHKELQAIQSEFLATDTDITDDLVHTALIATAFIETHLSVLHALLPIVSASG
jgi:putative membrane protein